MMVVGRHLLSFSRWRAIKGCWGAGASCAGLELGLGLGLDCVWLLSLLSTFASLFLSPSTFSLSELCLGPCCWLSLLAGWLVVVEL